MGCVKLKAMPGTALELLGHRGDAATPSCGHRSTPPADGGARRTSPWYIPIASVARSGRPELGDDLRHLGEPLQHLLDARRDLDRFGQRHGRQLPGLDQDRALVEARHELGAEAAGSDAERAAETTASAMSRVRRRWFMAPDPDAADTLARALEPALIGVRGVDAAQQERRRDGHRRSGPAARRPATATHTRDRHRREHLSLEALEGKDGR